MKKSYRAFCLVLGLTVLVSSVSLPVSAEETSAVPGVTGEIDDNSSTGSEGNISETDEKNNNITDKEETDKDPQKTEPASTDVDKGQDDKDDATVSEEYISDLKISQTDATTVELTWTILDQKFSGYKIAVYSDKEMKEQVGEVEKIEDAAQTAYELTDLESGKIYYIAVTPYKNANSRAADDEEVAGKELTGNVIILKVPEVTVKAGDAQLALSWKAVSGATGYEIYDVNSDKIIQTVTDTSYKCTGLKNNVSYSYKVRAVAKLGESTFVSDWSAVVGAKPTVSVPGQVKLSIAPYNKGAILSWTKVSGATAYYIYRYNSSTKKWVKIKQQTGTSYTDKGLKVNKTYYYRVSAVRTSGGATKEGAKSAQVSINAKEYLTNAVQAMWFKGTIKRKTKAYTSSTSKKSVRTIKKGTKVTVLHPGKKRFRVRLSNGAVYWVAKKDVRLKSCIYTSKDYTSAVKTDFVNKKGYSSKTKYLIWISKYTQRVNIYKGSKGKWKLIRTCRVATGRISNRTPSGVFKITYKEKGWFHRNTYEKPVVHFYGKASFHSRIYRNNGKLLDARIGKPVSGACVRMYMSDVNYIYKYIPVGTTVVSY